MERRKTNVHSIYRTRIKLYVCNLMKWAATINCYMHSLQQQSHNIPANCSMFELRICIILYWNAYHSVRCFFLRILFSQFLFSQRSHFNILLHKLVLSAKTHISSGFCFNRPLSSFPCPMQFPLKLYHLSQPLNNYN